MKSKKQSKSGSVKIEPETYIKARKLCKEQGWVIQVFVNNAVKEKIERESTEHLIYS